MLTAIAIKNAKPKKEPYKITDGQGLYLLVKPTGAKCWRYDYRFIKKRKTLALGVYPEVSIKEAREGRHKARELLDQGLDPSYERKIRKSLKEIQVVENFRAISIEWMEKQKPSWVASDYKNIQGHFKNHVYDYIGNHSIVDITAAELLAMLNRIVYAGDNETAKRVRILCSQVFRYAIMTGRAESDPTGDLVGALPSVRVKRAGDCIKRIAYFVSERTGITAELFGNSLLSQFPDVEFSQYQKPFINSLEKAQQLAQEFAEIYLKKGIKPLVFATLPDKKISMVLQQAPCHYYELFSHYLENISSDIGVSPTHISGAIHSLNNTKSYDKRMDIVNYTLTHDDAMTMKNINYADVILVGVSRSGKTPTCLYLALHYGMRAANYPLTEDDFQKDELPEILKQNKDKVIALTINPKRLADIREKRHSGGLYASLGKCRTEVSHALELFNRYKLTVFDTTSSSIEELSARIMQVVKS